MEGCYWGYFSGRLGKMDTLPNILVGEKTVLNNPRKQAGFMSLAATIGNLFVIGYLIDIRCLSELVSMLLTFPHFIFITVVGLISLAITALLFSPIHFNKKTKGAMLGISAVILIAAVIQASITVLFVLFWPWSLYRFYRSETI